MAVYRIGDIVSFSYKGQYSTEPFPQVLVLHTRWVRRNFPNEAPKVHGLAMHFYSETEIEYIKSVLNPVYAQTASQKNVHVAQWLKAVGLLPKFPTIKLTKPTDLYNQIVKNFRGGSPTDLYKKFQSQFKATSPKDMYDKLVKSFGINNLTGVFNQFVSQLQSFVPTFSRYNIESPMQFYNTFVKNFVKSKDGYRLYFPHKMTNVKVIIKKEVLIGKEEGVFHQYVKRFT